MPITRKQFEIGIDPKTEEWMKKIHSFLAEHKDEAFSEEELRNHYRPTLLELLSEIDKKLLAFGPRDTFDLLPDESSAFALALERLLELRAVAKSMIRGTEYYAYREELGEVL